MKNDIFNMYTVADIEGFNNYEAMVLMDCFLRFIEPANTMEIGTWDGKTAVIIANSTSGTFHYVECDATHFETTKRNVLSHTTLDEEHVKGYLNLSCYTPFTREYGKCMQFIHIDGAHSLEGVKCDLEISEKVLQPDGVIVLDDMYSPTYPQITEGVYEYLAHHSELKLFLVGLNKGLICYSSYYTTVVDFILDGLLNELKRYPFMSDALFSVCKTSGMADSMTYGIIGQDPKYDTHRYRGSEFNSSRAVERVIPDLSLN